MKVFVCIANYGTEQLHYLNQVIAGFKSFKKYDVFITVNSTVELDNPEINHVNLFDPSITVTLPMTCRKTIWENREDYDLFIYTENDHLFEEHHIDKFIEYSKILPSNYISGLFQYEENENGKWYPAYHYHFDWDYSSVETYGSKIFAHFNNIHQASFIITKDQLLDIGKKFDFTTYFQVPSPYDAICRTNTDIYMSGFKKVICISEFDQNLIHHLPNLYINGDKGRYNLGCNEQKMNESLEKLFKNKFNMKIINAVYGGLDVTEILRSYLINDSVSVLVTNGVFTDPIPNVEKYLIVSYEYDGKKREDTFKEGTTCLLPVEEKKKLSYTGKTTKVKFIIPLPDSDYYLWQVLVQINNFRRMGYEVEAHYPVCCFFGKWSETLIKFANSENIKSKFHIYHDNRADITYTASVKPWLMAQYFKEFPKERDFAYVYLDPDVIFLKPIDWESFTGDDIWYESDTCGYLNSTYIKSKGEGLFEEMCAIVGVSPELIMANDFNCGGAQYITKNNNYHYWSEVERISVQLYRHMKDTSDQYHPKDSYPIQAWTSEMWVTNWLLWKYGVETKCIPELDFHWANHPTASLVHNIYHNAGVVNDDGINFSKSAYQTSPFNKQLKGNESSLSYKYIEEIKNTEKNFPELLF